MGGDWAGMIPLILAAWWLTIAVRVALVARSTARRRGSWRAAFDRSRCDGCGTPSPVNTPRAMHEVVRRVGGGWTCETCGAACDRWGARRRV